jgi:HEAT repeat protein
VLPPLLEMTQDPDPLSRLQAVECLLAVAPQHHDVTAILTKLVHDPDEAVRTAAARALEKTMLAPR